jgi:hypothetical protein
MSKPPAAFDAEVFSRTTSLLASTRDALLADAVQTLAGDIASRLVSANLLGPAFDAPLSPTRTLPHFATH